MRVCKGEQIKAIRELHKETITGFARKLGISRSYLGQLENGTREITRANEKLRAKLDFLNIFCDMVKRAESPYSDAKIKVFVIKEEEKRKKSLISRFISSIFKR